MATRSIKLKLAVGGKSEEQKKLRQAIWTTHKVFNEGVAYYMQWLMLMRQRPIGDADAPEGDVLSLARAAQRANGAPSCPGSDEKIRALLRRLYEEIVPSSIGEKGDANQISRNYHSILVDPASKGGLGQSAGGRKPAWMQMADGPEKEAKRLAHEERKREEFQNSPRIELKSLRVLPLFEAFNRTKPAWQRSEGEGQNAVLTKGDRDMFQQALERLMSWESWTLRVQAEREKKDKDWQDLQTKYLTPEPEWRRRLCVYEKDREERLGRDAIRPETPFRIGERMIRGWEELQQKWQKSDRSEKRLTEIIAELQTEKRGRFGDASDFFPWLAQAENHFLWDGRAEKHAVRQHVALNEAFRKLEEAKEFANYTPPDALEHPLWARSGHSGDSNIHNYHILEEDGQLVAKLRLLFEDAQGRISERDETIALRPTGQWNRPQRGAAPSLHIVPYDQVHKQCRSGAKNEPKCTWLKFTDPGTGEECFGTLGGARLQLERDDFRLGGDSHANKKLREAAFAAGDSFPRAYLNVTVSLPDPPLNAGHRALKRAKNAETDPWTAVDYLLREDKKKACLEELTLDGGEMTEGLRIMSVDLGVRQLAACSVFELTRKPAGKKLTIPVAGADGLVMEHRRTFLLRLSGEEETAQIKETREQIRSRRQDLRAAINRLKQLLSLGRLDDPAKKRAEYDALRGEDKWSAPERRQRVDAILDPKKLGALNKPELIDKPNDPRWADEVIKVHRQWEKALGEEIAQWRRKGRSQGRVGSLRGYGGLSFWHIEELEDTRKLLNAWSCHSREYEVQKDGSRRPKVVRPKKRFGLKPGETPEGQDIDARLLAHINRLKEDRLKVGADMLVMAALGYEYKDSTSGWEKKHAPCQMVLFEDLSRYRFKTDRPRSENRMLMQWAHREIPRTVAMQGEVFGLTIGNIAAEFSSKFRASGDALTPGVRCRLVSKEDLDSKWFRDAMSRENKKNHKKEDDLPKEGALIAWEGGEWFCTINPDGSLYKINADLNAAQNLMRRFWRRYSETFRLSSRQALKDGSTVYLPKNLAKRLPRALNYDFGKEAVKLIPLDLSDIEKGCRLEPMPLKDYRKLTGTKAAKGENGEESSDEIGAEMEDLAEIRGDVVTFFRDPSGIVIPKHDGHDLWLPAKVFWGRVHSAIAARLAVPCSNAPMTDEEGDDLPF